MYEGVAISCCITFNRPQGSLVVRSTLGVEEFERPRVIRSARYADGEVREQVVDEGGVGHVDFANL